MSAMAVILPVIVLAAMVFAVLTPRHESRPQPVVEPLSRDTRTTEEQLAELDREIEYYQRRAELERRGREVDGEPAG
jgi:hypothetical protein